MSDAVRRPTTGSFLFLLIFLLASHACSTVKAADVLSTPYPGPPHSIGGDANGCLSGGVALSLSGPGWETLRPQRNRFWGNPALIAYIEEMAGKTRSLGTKLVADMAQPRGGHMTSDHASHQIGLDVDILFRLADRPLTDEERRLPAMESVVAADGALDPTKWGPRQRAMVKAFASDPRVERVFVNRAIKRQLCRQPGGGNRTWLAKVRPWWGHADHFHVRILCPAGDRDCVEAKPLPPGDGCGKELDWWFSQSSALPSKPPGEPQPVYRPTMPPACKTILGVSP